MEEIKNEIEKLKKEVADIKRQIEDHLEGHLSTNEAADDATIHHKRSNDG